MELVGRWKRLENRVRTRVIKRRATGNRVKSEVEAAKEDLKRQNVSLGSLIS